MTRLGERSNRAVKERSPAARQPAEAVAEVIGRIMTEVERKPLLYQAIFRAYAAGSAGRPEIDLSRTWPQRFSWIREATAGAEEADAIARVLAYTFLGGMVAVAAGQSIDVVREVLDDAVRLTLP